MANQQTVKVQLVRSPIGCKESHRATVRGLGLRKLNSVSELKAEITVEMAMVSANCRKNCPTIPVMNAHGTNTAVSTSLICAVGAGLLVVILGGPSVRPGRSRRRRRMCAHTALFSRVVS